jgi:hypothetical protein
MSISLPGEVLHAVPKHFDIYAAVSEVINEGLSVARVQQIAYRCQHDAHASYTVSRSPPQDQVK